MITANKEHTKIAGINLDIIYEFNSIIAALQEDNPEIVLGACAAWSSVLEEKLNDTNGIALAAVTHMSEDFIKGWKEDND